MPPTKKVSHHAIKSKTGTREKYYDMKFEVSVTKFSCVMAYFISLVLFASLNLLPTNYCGY